MSKYGTPFEPGALDPRDAELEPDTLIIADQSLRLGFVQLPKLILYARNISRDAKLLYAILLGYAWQELRCFPGYSRLCQDMGASENAVRKYMRELEAAGLLHQRRRGLGKTNVYTLTDLRTAKIEVQEPQPARTAKSAVQDRAEIAAPDPAESEVYKETEEIESEGEEPDPFSNGIYPSYLHKINRSSLSKIDQFRMRSNVENSAAPAGDTDGGRAPTPPGFAAVGDVLARRGRPAAAPQPPSDAPRRGRPPKAPPYIESVITDFSAQLHDDEHTPANITRATRLWRASGMTEQQFVQDVLYPARSITRQQGGVTKRAATGGGLINRMPYFFSVVEDLLGMKDAPGDERSGPSHRKAPQRR